MVSIGRRGRHFTHRGRHLAFDGVCFRLRLRFENSRTIDFLWSEVGEANVFGSDVPDCVFIWPWFSDDSESGEA